MLVNKLITSALWFSSGTPVSTINKIDRRDITGILLKVALNTITPDPKLINTLIKLTDCCVMAPPDCDDEFTATVIKLIFYLIIDLSIAKEVCVNICSVIITIRTSCTIMLHCFGDYVSHYVF